MQIRFRYNSSPQGSREQAAAIMAQFTTSWAQVDLPEIKPAIEIGGDHKVVIQLAVDLSQPPAAGESDELASKMVGVFAELASVFETSWQVGHEFESQLGTIDSTTPLDDLIEEVQTAIKVAGSLTGIIVNDEFVEPDSTFSGKHEIADDESWSELLESPEGFIRFPEWD